MKRTLLLLLCFLTAMNIIFAGGIVTNTNQSAAWARMLIRDASVEIDAVYYNPAGLTKLSDGLHISVSNQSIFQKRKISNSLIPNTEYEGDVIAYFFPNFYAAYKTGKFVISAGFLPIAGGGSASFDNGIPMIDLMIATLPGDPQIVALANSLGLTPQGAYKESASFDGSSVYFGIQGGVSYAFTEMISAYAGVRYVMAKNSYEGSIKGLTVTTDNPAIPINLPDMEVDAEQKGTGIAPILGLDLTLMEAALNIGVKYEFQTNIDVENDTKVDDMGMFLDGEKVNADIPAMLSVGVGYKFNDVFSTQIGYHTYFDKNAGWAETNNISLIDKNTWEIGVGFEYIATEKLLLSAGYYRGLDGTNDYYQTDMSYSLSSNNFGLGGAYKLSPMMTLQLGGYYTHYDEATIVEPSFGIYSQTYNKSHFAFAVGLDFNFGGQQQ